MYLSIYRIRLSNIRIFLIKRIFPKRIVQHRSSDVPLKEEIRVSAWR